MKKVVKFGGSSLANSCQFKKVKEIIESDRSRCYVVPSAPGKRDTADDKVTDLLYQYFDLAVSGKNSQSIQDRIKSRYDEIIAGLGLDMDLTAEFEKIHSDFCSGAGRDYAASRGEYLNGLIMAKYLGYTFVDAAKVIRFDEDGIFLSEETNEALKKRLAHVSRAVIPGFYGAMPDGTVKTFSRGGSDITGSLVARAVDADLYENWTDVSGFLLADPRIVDDPIPIEVITYRELRELACMGASVLHEDAVFPVRQAGIPINIRNTNRPEDPGTMIVRGTAQKPNFRITGIAGRKGFCAVNIHKACMKADRAFGSKVLDILRAKHIPFEHVPAGVDTMSVFVDQKEFKAKEKAVLAGIQRCVNPDSISLEDGLALVAVGGRGRRAKHSIAGRVFSVLEQENIAIRSVHQGIEDLAMVVGVRDEDFESTVRAIYDDFINVAENKKAVALTM